MSTNVTTKEEATLVRERVKYEDQVLNSRTSNILVLNGLIALASGIDMPKIAFIGLIIVILLIDFFWFIISLDARRYIYGLTDKLKEADAKNIVIPVDEKMRFEIQNRKYRIGATNIMTIAVPVIAFAGWILVLILKIF